MISARAATLPVAITQNVVYCAKLQKVKAVFARMGMFLILLR